MVQQFRARLTTVFQNKAFWQLILAAFMLGMAVFFIRQEHLELLQIRQELHHTHISYVVLGLLLSVAYVFTQGLMYRYSFRALGQQVPLLSATQLFLKRNLVSVFLPAGGFSSLAFFTKSIEARGISRSQILLASTIFSFCGLVSVVVVAIPALGYALLQNSLQGAEVLGFVFLLVLVGIFLYLFWSVSRKGWLYRLIVGRYPSAALVLDEMLQQQVNRRAVGYTILVSVVIEFIGVAHLYLALLALGLLPSLTAAFLGYVVMVILLIASPFLRGLGAIEVSVTFILGRYGYSVVEAATATLLFRLFEFWVPLLLGVSSFLTKKDNLLLRLMPALIILAVGLINVISAITPAIPARLRLVNGLLPTNVVYTSNMLVLMFGLVLLLLSVFLLQGSRRAWVVATTLLLLSFTGHLIKGADYEEATLSLLACLMLLYTRRQYRLKPHPRYTRISLLTFLFGVVAVLAYGVIGFYFIDKRHFAADFTLQQAVERTLRLLFLFDDDGLTPLTRFAHYFIFSIYAAGAGVILLLLYGLLRPYFSKPFNTEQDWEQAQALLDKYGQSALDYFKVYPDKQLFFSEDRETFLAFKVTRLFAFVLENPVAKDAAAFQAIIRSFDRYCTENGFVSIFYRVPERSLPLYSALGKKSFPIGEEAVLDLTTFTIDGGKMKPTRSALNRLTGEGYSVKAYDPPVREGILQKLEQVSTDWLQALGQQELTFTQGVFDPAILKTQTILTVEDQEEKVYAFLNLVPDYVPGEATYDLIRKVGNAPNGVLDLLLVKTYLYLKEKGYTSVNLGLAPMSGIAGRNMTQRGIRYAYEHLRVFGHFVGLRKYKEKFFPKWEQKYLIYEHDYHLVQVPAALRRVSEAP
ncbi:phosphatidylglycerol lysyltransferase domain-containing protein [Pontibacter chitinilyticus]|uniref:phosphatidylglycerol lysyltransferase domain-containing protein n=1 Tax=Pontibacter chitinilyticus TaxID=2674989 RepID=UPI00321B7BD2